MSAGKARSVAEVDPLPWVSQGGASNPGAASDPVPSVAGVPYSAIFLRHIIFADFAD